MCNFVHYVICVLHDQFYIYIYLKLYVLSSLTEFEAATLRNQELIPIASLLLVIYNSKWCFIYLFCRTLIKPCVELHKVPH